MSYPGAHGYGQNPAGGGQYGQQPPAGYGAPMAGQQRYSAPPGQQPMGGAPHGQPPMSGYPGAPAAGGGGYAPPGMDPNVFQWFSSVDADRSGKISVMELQQALTNANWSHFNPETCRLMIAMFDKDFSGTIDINEFQALWNYLQQWRSTFERYDRDRSGAIDTNELQAAFQQMGFNLSPVFVNVVVQQFDMYGKRQLTLDSFIQVCVLLQSLTNTFRQRDTNMSGSIRMSYEDFMCLALLNKP